MATDSAAPETEQTPKLSAVEGMKETSRWLRGTLAEELHQDTDHFNESDKNLLKFHGSYQQEDRDARKSRPKTGVAGKAYMFMIRLKLPGGKLTAKQYLALDEIAGKYANGTIRFTTRQSIQFHGILKSNLKQTMQDINASLVTTLGGCGDVNRNVMACPAPLGDPIRKEMQSLADSIAAHLAPRSKAYHDIWLNGEAFSPDADQEEGVEPIYGKVYLPRKFKIGLSLPYDNCIDVFAQDLGFLAIVENGHSSATTSWSAAAWARTHGNANTFAHLGQAHLLRRTERGRGHCRGGHQILPRSRQSCRSQSGRASSMWFTTGASSGFARCWRGTISARRWFCQKPVEITDVDLHLGWHPKATANGSWV